MKTGFRVKPYAHPKLKFVVRGKVAGKWQRRYFETKGEATTYAQQQNTRLLNEGRNGIEFPEWLRLSAQRAYETLLPFKKTLEDAVAHYVAHLERATRSVPVDQAVDELIATRVNAGASQRYCNDLRLRLGRFVGHHAGRCVADFSTADIDEWLSALGVAPGTRNTFRRDLRTLFSFCQTRRYIAENPAAQSQRAKEIDAPVGILKPEDLARLLHNADPEVLPYFAIGAFAGLRAAEIGRLDWSEIDLERRLIHVGAKKSKTATRRLVTILPNLEAWLLPYALSSGPVTPRNLRAHVLGSRAHAGISEWPSNALRHSFASYHIAHFKDAGGLALQLGHTTEALIFRHYREVVRPTDAAKYWQIMPQRKERKIVRFPEAV